MGKRENADEKIIFETESLYVALVGVYDYGDVANIHNKGEIKHKII